MNPAWIVLLAQIAVLPVQHPEEVSGKAVTLFTERLMVALDKAGLQAVPSTAKKKDDQLLATRLVAEDGAYTCFALLSEADGTVLRRQEWSGVDEKALEKTLPGEVASWVAGAAPVEEVVAGPTLALVPPMDPAGFTIAKAMTARLAGQLAAWDSLTVAVTERAADAARSPYRADLTIDVLEVVRRRHHVRDYLDGRMVATLTISDSRDGTVLFSKQASAKHSRKAKKSSADAVATVLAAQIVKQWMASFRGQVSVDMFQGGAKR